MKKEIVYILFLIFLLNNVFSQKSDCPTIYQGQDICMVTVDQTINKAVVVWERKKELGIKSFIIYKVMQSSGDWIVADTIPFEKESIWTDYQSNPDTTFEMYKIAVIDTCGNVSTLSRMHSSVYLACYRNISLTNLTWTPPTLTPTTDYINWEIYGGNTLSKMKLIETGPIINDDFIINKEYLSSDSLSKFRYYSIAYVKKDTCYPTLIRKGIPIYARSTSNLADLGFPPKCVSQPYQGQDICLVTIDQTINKAVVVWERKKDLGIKSYIIYKLSHTIANKWDVAADIPFENESVWIDQNSNPDLYPESYKIAVMDTCGNISDPSRTHRSIFLEVIRNYTGLPYTNFNWNRPTITPVNDYYKLEIYGGDTLSKLKIISSITIQVDDTTTFIANWDPASQFRYYYLVYFRSDTCYPSIIKKAPPFAYSISNLPDLGFPPCQSKTYQNFKICLVTVDSTTHKTTLVWERPKNLGIESFLIFKKNTNVSPPVWDVLDTIPFTQNSIWTDPTSNPDKKTEFYKFGILDTCGNLTYSNVTQNSIYLSLTKNADNIKLSWNNPSKDPTLDFNYFKIFGGNNPSGLNLIFTGSNFDTSKTFFQSDPSSQYKYYIVIFYKIDTCQSAINKKGDLINLSQITSNLAYFDIPIGITSTNEFSFHVSPNPAHDELTIYFTNSEKKKTIIEITDLLGNIITQQELVIPTINHSIHINLSSLTKGIYFIRVKSDNYLKLQKLIIN